MKIVTFSLASLLLAGLVTAGCSKKATVDTTPVEKSFQSAEPTTKSAADKAVASIKAGDYSSAMADLQKLASNVKLTPEQKQAIQDVLGQVQKALSEAAGKAVEGADKAAKDLQKSLPK